MQSLLTVDVVRDAVAQQFGSTGDETDLAVRATPTTPHVKKSVRRTRTRLADALHHAADAVAPASYRSAH
jgi:hypothetical protein